MNLDEFEQLFLDIPPPYDRDTVAMLQMAALTLVRYARQLEQLLSGAIPDQKVGD